jgi:hypothetical protein
LRQLTFKNVTKRTLELPQTIKKPLKQGAYGGRTRDRTLDLSRVKGTLSR